MMQNDNQGYDLVVVGGGINGAGIARDAAGRGLNVLLCERDDLAEHTSSASTKLIHGGLRYLEQYEFSLVRKALKERDVLLRAAPHIIWPMRFVMPHAAHLRPRWLIRAGLFLYDHLGGRSSLARSRAIKLPQHEAGGPLRPEFVNAYEYSDCWVQDSRLVVLNVLDAAERGADVRTRTSCTHAVRRDGRWEVELEDHTSGRKERIQARAVVNAAGPWVSSFLQQVSEAHGERPRGRVRLVKGSHLVVPTLFNHASAYLLQNADGRVVFVIPYEQDFTLVGTTDESFDGDPAAVAIEEHERRYLCATVNDFFRQSISPDNVIWSYSGVRPLYDDLHENASEVTRDYRLELNGQGKEAPLLSVFGGKITTYRTLAEEALRLLQPALGFTAPAWTARTHLPGGDIPNADFEGWLDRLRTRYGFLPEALLWRYARNYGSRVERIVGDARTTAGLGEHLGDNIHAAELEYLVDYEWARTANDVLWRRSRMGLHVSTATRQAIDTWLQQRLGRAGGSDPREAVR